MKRKLDIKAAFLAVAIAGVGLIATQHVEHVKAEADVASQGFTNVKVEGWNRSKAACDLFDMYGAPFTATSKAGETVTGSVCRPFAGSPKVKLSSASHQA